MDASIAFLGTGLMGNPMAMRMLEAGYTLNVWNRSNSKLEPLQLAGARPCRTPADAAQRADFVCLCLTDATAVEHVLFGASGVVQGLQSNTIILDFSTIGPIATRQLADRVAQSCGATWLDCPVSGGVAGAQAGTLSVFAGGDSLALERAMPLLSAVAAHVTHMGPIGAGQATKLCNQLIVSTNLLAIAEAMHVGEALGVDIGRLPLALQGGFADSRPLQIFGPRMAPSEDAGAPVSELRMMYKDIDAIRTTAAAADAAVPLLDHVAGCYRTLVEAGLGGEDVPVLMRLYRKGKGLATTALPHR